jgi:hypothetical protein
LPQRNAQRAQTLADIIAQQMQNLETNLGSWTRDALRLAEAIARDMVEEVAEWSMVYAKELIQTSAKRPSTKTPNGSSCTAPAC